jgi:hypothetical protein
VDGAVDDPSFGRIDGGTSEGGGVQETVVDEKTGRKFFLDLPDLLDRWPQLTFVLNLHGGGSHGTWQRFYFPAHDYAGRYGLVIATPSAATKNPVRRWSAEPDDEHLRNIVDLVFDRFGTRIRAFWLAGHSQGGMTASRLLDTDFFANRVDGWLSLSGGRIGRAEPAAGFGRPTHPGEEPRPRPPGGSRIGDASMPETDLSFIFSVGEHEIVELPEGSPLAERYGAGPKRHWADVVDEQPGQIYDRTSEGRSNPIWGLAPRPGTARIFVYPGAQGGWLVADVMRLDKGHTEGLEPKITEELVKLMVSAPGGKAHRVSAGSL